LAFHHVVIIVFPLSSSSY